LHKQGLETAPVYKNKEIKMKIKKIITILEVKKKLSKIIILMTVLLVFTFACGGGGSSGGGGNYYSNQSDQKKNVFVTSVKGNGNLNSWPDAGGKTGLEAADAICQARADTAGLKGTFVAWLSDYTDDAYCRIHNLKGKKSNNCGQTSLPIVIGPWIRTDGFPFGESIEQILQPNAKIYAPIRYDEFGNVIASRQYFTATLSGGTLDPSREFPCANWTSTSVSGRGLNAVIYGDSNRTGYSWGSAFGIAECSSNQSLLCFETGDTSTLPNYTSMGKKVFLTSVKGNGNLSSWPDAGGKTGLTAGDTICQSRATTAGLTGNFKAWLSDSTTNAVDRITSDGPWVRLDGVKVADNKADLIDGMIFTSINVTDAGEYEASDLGVYTGTDYNGVKTFDTCNDWSSYSVNANIGVADSADSNWTDRDGVLPCTASLKLYCFED
jgi:hypothetical protein